MSGELALLLGTAASLGFIHTLAGPDHYLPFVAMARIGRWSWAKTAMITALCGVGHILSSLVLAFTGIAFGVAINRLEVIESARGEIAAWMLIAFGLTYFIWGMHRAIRGKSHEHHHTHEDDGHHVHEHDHTGDHSHAHHAGSEERMTPYILFTIFVFGPCEVLIPLLMATAARHPISSVMLVAGLFGISTISTMLSVVMGAYFGLSKSRLNMGGLEKYSYAAAGLVIFLCGGAIKWLGL